MDVIEILGNWHKSPNRGNFVTVGHETVGELIGLAKQGKRIQWVSVAEKLPEDGQAVDLFVNRWIKRLTDCTYHADKKQFYNPHAGMIRWVDIKEVTHWREIPPNPRGAE